MDDLHPPGQSSPDVPIIIQHLHFSHSDLISEVISDYRTSGAETSVAEAQAGGFEKINIIN